MASSVGTQIRALMADEIWGKCRMVWRVMFNTVSFSLENKSNGEENRKVD